MFDLMRRCVILLSLGLALTVAGADAVRMEQGESGAIRLENEFLRVKIEPSLGGAVTELIHKKSGKNLAGNFIGERPAQGFGLLLDRFWPRSGGQVRNLETLPYSAQTLPPDADHRYPRVLLRLTCDHPNAKDLLIEKMISLRPGVARLEAEVSISNVGQKEQVNRYWCTNVLRPDGPRCEKLTYFSPAPEGVVAHLHDPKREEGENVWVTPQRDWRAVIGESGVGAAVLVDSRYVEKLYSFLPSAKGGADHPTLEWLYQSVRLKPIAPPEGEINRGSPFRTEVAFVPFEGLKAVHGASRDFVGEIELDEKKGEVLVRIASAVTTKATVELDQRTLPATAPRRLATQQLSLSPNSNAELRFSAGDLGQGTHLFVCRVSAQGCEMAVLERHFVVGEPSGKYTLARLTPKAPEALPEISTTISTTVESEHVKWAKPYAGGKLRALVVIPMRSSREVVEVWQRVDMDFSVLPTFSVSDLEAVQAKPILLHQKMLQLLEQEWDVIIFGATYWRMWPAEVQKAIAQKIYSGTGAVYVWVYGNYFAQSLPGHRATKADESFLRDALPTRLIPPWQKDDPSKLIGLAEYGKGRIVLLNYPVAPDPRGLRHKSMGGLTPMNPTSDADYPFWEYHHSLLAKAMLWAGRKLPPVSIVKCGLSPQKMGGNARLPVTLSGALHNLSDRAREIILHIWAHDERGERMEVDPAWIRVEPKAESPFTLSLPVPRNSGLHLVTLWAKEDGSAHDWRTLSFEVASPAHIEPAGELPAILPRDAPLSARAKVKAERPIKGELLQEIVDATGRLVWEEKRKLSLEAGENILSISATPKHCLIGRHRLNLSLLEDGGRVARLSLPFAVDVRRYDDYISIIWGGGGGGYLGRVMAHVLADTECFDAVVTGAGRQGGYQEAEAAAEHIAGVGMGIYAINLHHFHCNEPGLVRKPCFTDPKAQAELREELREKTQWLARFAPIAYLMGDEMSLGPENGFTDFCQSPTCLAGFRDFLRRNYGTIERLNASWRTAFPSFEEVKPFTFAEAQKARNYAPWADHRAFMDTVYAGAFRFAREVFAERDPRPLVGYSGGATWNIAVNGYNRWELYQVCKAVTDYGPDSPDLMRSFMQGDRISSWWWGMYGGAPENVRRHTPWMLAFRGLNGSGFFAAFGTGHDIFGDYGLLNPGYIPKPNVLADLREDVKPLREGIGKLLLSSRRLNSGIALHYSHPSVRAAYVLDEKPVNEKLWNRARWGMGTALRDMGFQFDLIAPAQIEEGMLREFRVLILPLSQSLSIVEAAAIRRFVERGGVLIADPLAGRFDEHLASQETPLLGALLGVAGSAPAECRANIVVEPNSPLAGLPEIPSPPLCEKLMIKGADVWARASDGKSEAILAQRVGEGVAYTLNFTFAPYLDLRSSDKGRVFLDLLRRLLTRHNIAPEIEVLKDGRTERGVEIVQFESGGARFVGMLQDYQVRPLPGEKVIVRLPRRAHVYDMLRRMYLGETSELETELPPARASLFALLPERVQSIMLALPREARQGEALPVQVHVGEPIPYGRVLRVELLGPDGRPRCLYNQNIFSTDGRFRALIPLALNDPCGEWSVNVREIASGLAAQGAFSVTPR